jgi:outer membrane lipoprotein-sorting protein
MLRTALPFLVLPLLLAQDQAAPGQKVESLADLIAAVKAKEAAVKSLQMKMMTTGVFPDGRSFETRGTLRLLGRTHVHSLMAMETGDVRNENETVKTPDGVWMRERNPFLGEVFVVVKPEILQQLKEAAVTLGQVTEAVGSQDLTEGPLGSRMLEDLGKQYDLKVSESKLEGVDCWVAKGPARAAPEGSPDTGRPTDVEILVRKHDGLVIRMVQFQSGKPMLTVAIQELTLNADLDAKSFSIALPGGQRWKDVKDHPPAWMQIQSTLEEARLSKEKGEKKDGEKKDGEKKEGEGEKKQ